MLAVACGGANAARNRAGADTGKKDRALEPRIDRIVVSPDLVASVSSSASDPHGAVASILVLGKKGDDRRLFFHFPVTLPDHGTLKSAELLLTKTSDVDMAPVGIELHALRIVEPWDPLTLSWPLQPRIEEALTPHAIVTPAGAKIVRIDVKAIVDGWPARDPADQGIAVLADTSSRSGASFAYISAEGRPPELELLWAFPDGPVDAGAPSASASATGAGASSSEKSPFLLPPGHKK